MFRRKRKNSPAELANGAAIDTLRREAMVGELERGFAPGPPSGTRGPWPITLQGGGDLKLPDDKPYDGDAEQTSP